ncbi:hypothetical protein [Niabella ginsengisoli]|uniref:Uncharacterized protein n=1 Tax=Niabella ginsengisoli TaxID=522298 RepID=A0ABS9SHT9_9BACT|nr:hypothetical protein [Niabella ginsengisoli]MCH5597927.1 hypothetical protein [Niabella ginsengisoli]
MKNRVYWIVLLGLFSISFSNCTKNNNSKPIAIVADILPGNVLNPYDSFGVWHNLILDSLEKQPSSRSLYGFDNSYGFIRQFYRMKNWPVLSADHFNEIPQIVNDAAINMHEFIDHCRWSDSVKSNLLRLIGIMHKPPVDTSNYPVLKQTVSRFEKDVLQSDLSVGDKEVILKVASIARHSAYRWMQRPGANEFFHAAQLEGVHHTNGVDHTQIISRGNAVYATKMFKK